MIGRTMVWGLIAIGVSGVAGFGLAAWADAPPAAGVRVIKVSASRFVFSPATITVKLGETVDLELMTQDVVMGFNVPDLAMRSTLVPGQSAHLKVTPQKTGTYPFLCDVFCGSGHEDMNGVISVVE